MQSSKLTPSIAGYLEKNRIRPVGASAIWKVGQKMPVIRCECGPYFTNCQDVIDIETLEQGPHGKVDINQATTEIQTARESRNDLKASLAVILGACIKLDEISSSRSRVS